MPWYVFALADRPPRTAPGPGFTSAVTFRRIEGIYAAVERRSDVPPAELGSLERHQRVVERLATRVPAILPVRFGTVVTMDEIAESLDSRRDDIAAALDLVRGRRQMTWRLARARSISTSRKTRPFEREPASGSEYLHRAARGRRGDLPPGLRQVRSLLGPRAAAERDNLRDRTLTPALYHLVNRTDVAAYVTASRPLRAAFARLVLTGPWAPYAFAPEIL